MRAGETGALYHPRQAGTERSDAAARFAEIQMCEMSRRHYYYYAAFNAPYVGHKMPNRRRRCYTK